MIAEWKYAKWFTATDEHLRSVCKSAGLIELKRG